MPLPRLVVAALALVVFAAPAALRADAALPKILGDNMVLQRGVPVPIWGTASPGEAVSVSFAGRNKFTTADAAGHWHVILDPLPASFEPDELTVTANNTLRLQNILVGEVWLCGGQSNMEYAVDRPTAGAPPATKSDAALAAEIKNPGYPAIRLFRVQKILSPPDVVSSGWTACAGDDLAIFSAIGFFFARDLQHALGVPVGVIQSAWGGSRIEPWTPAAAYAAFPAFKDDLARQPLKIDGMAPGKYYDAMVRPLAPFALRGVLWYQGESNIIATNDGVRYADKLQVLVTAWRAAWHNPSLPFYQVQLAPYYYTKRKDPFAHGPDELPKLWEAQFLALHLPHTYLVPTLDLDSNFANIHPNGKRIVAQRLAGLVLADTYGGKKITYAGPSYDGVIFSGNTAEISFDNSSAGLASRDQKPLTEFEIAGPDGNFVPATAVIQSRVGYFPDHQGSRRYSLTSATAIKTYSVIVSSPQVPNPAAVRFAWRETAQPNLINQAGLPAYPFRTNGPNWKPTLANPSSNLKL